MAVYFDAESFLETQAERRAATEPKATCDVVITHGVSHLTQVSS